MVGRTFWFLCYSMTSALHVDSLVMMEELHLFHEGKYGIGYLWQPYWGQRLLIPRLLFMADERFFHLSNTPLVAISILAQMLATAVLLWTEWRLLRAAPRWLALVVMAATLHLAFSSLQLESFLFGIEVLFTAGLLGAFASIALSAKALSDYGPSTRSPGTGISVRVCSPDPAAFPKRTPRRL
jgi:hypothetical protein